MGPVSCLIAYLLDLGWRPWHWNSWQDPEGNTWQVDAEGSAQPFLNFVERLAQDLQWKKLAECSADNKGMEFGIDLQPVQALRRQFGANKQWAKERTLAKISIGGVWLQARLHAAGLAETPLCPRCGQHPETMHHAVWRCVCNKKLAEGPDVIEAVKDSNHLRHEACSDEGLSVPIYWTRGLLPKCIAPVPAPSDEGITMQNFGRLPRHFGGLFGSDGSGGEQEGVLKRAGWGWARHDQRGGDEIVEMQWGSLGGPHQTTPRAELTAVLKILVLCNRPAQIWTDHFNIVRGFDGGPNHTQSSANGDLWCAVWEEIWRLRVQGHSVSIMWIRSHTDEVSSVHASTSLPALLCNMVADELAKEGAKLDLPTDFDKQRYKDECEKVSLVAKRAVEIVAHLKLAERRRPPKPEQQAKPEKIKQQILKLAITTTHQVKLIGRRYRCQCCFAFSPPASRRTVAWLQHQCPGRTREGEESFMIGGPHPSHVAQLAVTGHFVFCVVCARWGVERFVSLRAPCPGPPHQQSLFHMDSLRKLQRGLLPHNMKEMKGKSEGEWLYVDDCPEEGLWSGVSSQF